MHGLDFAPSSFKTVSLRSNVQRSRNKRPGSRAPALCGILTSCHSSGLWRHGRTTHPIQRRFRSMPKTTFSFPFYRAYLRCISEFGPRESRITQTYSICQSGTGVSPAIAGPRWMNFMNTQGLLKPIDISRVKAFIESCKIPALSAPFLGSIEASTRRSDLMSALIGNVPCGGYQLIGCSISCSYSFF